MRKALNIAFAGVMIAAAGLFTSTVHAANHQNAGATPPKLKTGVTLSINDFFDSANKNDPGRLAMEKVAQAWAAKTHNHVTFNGHPDNEQNKLCVDGPSGNGEDLIGVPHDQLAVMYACKVLATVPEWAWPAKVRAGYIKAALQATNIGGKYIAMPWGIETTGMFYNKSLISASAFKPKGKGPLAWTQLIPKLQSLTHGDQFGLGYKLDDFYFTYALISNAGGYVFKYSSKTGFNYNNIGLDNSGAIKGFQFVKDLSTSGKYNLIPVDFPGGNGYNRQESLFDSGKMAVWVTGPWAEENMDKGGVKYGFVPMPSLDGKHPAHPFSGVQVYAVNKYTKHLNEAMSLLSYMTQNMQLPEVNIQHRPPVIKALYNNKVVKNNPVTKALAAAAINASPMPNIPEMGQVWDPMANALNLVVKGTLDPATAAHQAVQKIKQNIAALHGG